MSLKLSDPELGYAFIGETIPDVIEEVAAPRLSVEKLLVLVLRFSAAQYATMGVELQSRSENSCPKCAELWAAYDSATRKYIGLLKDQAEIAGISLKRSRLLDPLIETAFRQRNAAATATEVHRVLDHGKNSER